MTWSLNPRPTPAYFPEQITVPGDPPARSSRRDASLGLRTIPRQQVVEDLSIDDASVVLRLRHESGSEYTGKFDAQVRLLLDGQAQTRDAAPSMRDYAAALEPGRLIDLLIHRGDDGSTRFLAAWCSVDYDDQRTDSPNLKPDGLFSWKLANAEKDERVVAAWLDGLGHSMAGQNVHAPPYVVVLGRRYAGHRSVNQDLTCRRCGLEVEVKGRPNDDNPILSSSRTRSFVDENQPNGINVLVFRHSRMLAFRNRAIIAALPDLDIQTGQYDTWVRLPTMWVSEHRLEDEGLRCAGASVTRTRAP